MSAVPTEITPLDGGCFCCFDGVFNGVEGVIRGKRAAPAVSRTAFCGAHRDPDRARGVCLTARLIYLSVVADSTADGPGS